MRLRWVVALGSLLGCGYEVGDLGRNDYKHFNATCEKGINQQVENADPVRECLDARNVWAPDGRVVQRPGYTGIVPNYSDVSVVVLYGRGEDTSAGTFTSPSGAGVLDLSNLVGRVTPGGNMDRWYLGYSSKFSGALLTVVTTNSNSTRFKAEYWNGTSWSYLNCRGVFFDATNSSYREALNHLNASTFLMFVAPGDWASTTVDSQAAYWIRFNLLDADFDATVTVDVDAASTGTLDASNTRALVMGSFPNNVKRYITITNSTFAGLNRYYTFNSAEIYLDAAYKKTGGSGSAVLDEPPSAAVVSEFNEMFVPYGNAVWNFKAFPTFSDALVATVDDRDAVIGPGAPFDRNLIVQDASFPQAKYITFFKNRLWAANLLGNPTAVKWSGRSPYYRVWPSLSIEPLVEDDNSPITGMTGFHENLVVTKEDSIWTMREDGLNEFSLTQYTPVRVVPGIGSVSNSSMVEIEGRLFMLWENGLYAFDGTPNIDRVSKGKGGGDRLSDVWQAITPGRRPFACAVNWSTMGLYLLAVSVDGSETNNLVVAYDYRNDAFWLWDDIEAQHWMRDQGADDEEIIYFGDSAGRIYQLGVGRTDHGGTISSYYTTHRLGYEDGMKKVLREARLHGDSAYLSAQVDIYANDKAAAIQTATLDFSDPVETVNYRPLERRSRRGDFRVEGDWFQIKVSNATKNTELHSGLLKVGYLPIARR